MEDVPAKEVKGAEKLCAVVAEALLVVAEVTIGVAEHGAETTGLISGVGPEHQAISPPGGKQV